jgi:hypothetical protein
MRCPLSAVEGKGRIVSDRSYEKLPGSRSGEGDDKTGDNLEGVCEEDQLDRGGTDTWV